MSLTTTPARFAFGKNWARFSEHIDEARISSAIESLQKRFKVQDFKGKRFLDIGSGSGLFSLAAFRLGAEVHSFDFDKDSVACTAALKDHEVNSSSHWTVQQGSVLDKTFMETLGTFDYVYSWGVLHHTGAMWEAIAQAITCVAPNGSICMAIYNDQGLWSRSWTSIKKGYNRLPSILQPPYAFLIGAFIEGKAALGRMFRGQNPFPFEDWSKRRQMRGMSVWHDLLDWVGGYPFEVATPQAVVDFLKQEGFALVQLKTVGSGLGCNEFVFARQNSIH